MDNHFENLSMLENELFPTPDVVIEEMVAPYIEEYKSRQWLNHRGKIFDPHGGTGAILKYLTTRFMVDPKNLITCEINLDLRLILQAKGYRVVGADFLEFDEPADIGLILMNPPFSTGAKHVLKGWDILSPDGNMTALLNRETIDNPCTKEREILLNLLATQIGESYPGDGLGDLLDKLQEKGKIKYLGQCFKNSERPTDVDVVIIHLHKPEQEKIRFDFGEFDVDGGFAETDFSASPLAHNDAVRNLVARYNCVVDLLRQRQELQSKIDFYLDGISKPLAEVVKPDEVTSLTAPIGLAEQVGAVKARFWNTVFEKTQIGDRLTSSFRDGFRAQIETSDGETVPDGNCKEVGFDQFSRSQSAIAFTERNVKELLALFLLSREELMQRCLVEVFDKATAYHAENKIHVEGWKTNKGYRLNKKIIMPNGVNFRTILHWFEAGQGIQDFLDDMDKVLCWLSATPVDVGLNTWKSLKAYLWDSQLNHQQKFDSHFFEFRFYKKGTLHLYFKDLKLLESFNSAAAKGKKWIGGGY